MKEINLAPSAKLFYSLGLIVGDGNVCKAKRGNYIIRLINTSKTIVKSYQSAIESIGMHTSVVIYPPTKARYGKKPIYCITGHSKKFYEFYKNMTLETLKEMLILDDDYITAFLRGFYEAEGSLKKRGDLAISNSDENLLKLVKDLILTLGIECWVRGPYIWGTNRKSMYLIQIGERKARKFIDAVKPCIRNQFQRDKPLGRKRSRWTKAELELLRSEAPIDELRLKLKNRTNYAIRNKLIRTKRIKHH